MVNSYTRAMADVGVWQRVSYAMTRARVTLDNGGGVRLISNVSEDTPVVVTALGHGYVTGDWITILNVRGMDSINALWRITVLDSSRFSLDGSTPGSPYLGGGIATRSPIPEFDYPLSCALAFMKFNPANPITPGDEDFAHLSVGQWQELIDIAEAEFFGWLSVASSSSIAGGDGKVEERLPDYSYRKDPLIMQYATAAFGASMEKVRRLYRYNVATMAYGSFDHGFQANWKRHRASIYHAGE